MSINGLQRPLRPISAAKWRIHAGVIIDIDQYRAPGSHRKSITDPVEHHGRGGARYAWRLGSSVALPAKPGRQGLLARVKQVAALQFNAARCLRLRSRYSDCEKCARACPSGSLRVSCDSLELPARCLSCGRCCAACPTGALRVEGFSVSPPVTSSESIYVDCWKVPPFRPMRGAVRVPCLGGIAVHELVRWHTACAPRPIVLLDRGWCSQCSAGSKASHPAQAALDAARELLAELGVPERALPRFERKLLPRKQMPDEIPDAINRRDFLSSVTRDAVRALAPAVVGRRAKGAEGHRPALHKVEIRARLQLLAQAALLSKQHRRPLPTTLFPALRVSKACQNHKVCAAICPTGALRAYEDEDGGTSGIAFDAAACIACGDCTRACSERAIELLALGDGEVPRGATILTRRALRECRDCGYKFADSTSDTVCPACQKTRDLARASLSQLFGVPHGTRDDPSVNLLAGSMKSID